MQSISFDAIGTSWQIDIYTSLSESKLQEITAKIKKRVDEFDKVYSRFGKDSWVTKLSKEKGIYPLPHDAEPLFDIYKDLYDKSEGLFTPLVGNVLEDAGYDSTYSLKPKKLSQPLNWQDAIFVHDNTIEVKQPVLLDFGAGGKGYIIDIIGQMLQENGVNSFCVDAGGDMLHQDSENKKIRIGLENPNNTKQVIGVVEIANKSICGSAGNRRKWADFHHIINPKTLTSPQAIIALWVIADTTLIADSLSTFLFLCSDTIKLKDYKFEYLKLFSDMTIEKSEGFEAEFFY